MNVRCTTTGWGSKGAVIVCDTPEGTITFKALKLEPGKYEVYSEYPPRRYQYIITAPRVKDIRRRLEELLSTLY